MSPTRMARTLTAATCACTLPSIACADTLTLTADRDTTIYQSGNTLSSGAGVSMFSGRTLSSGLRRALIRFDLSEIPTGSNITDVSVRLTLTMTVGDTGPSDLHRLLADWGESTSNAGESGGRGAPAVAGDATWHFAFVDTTPWTADGGDFEPASSGTIAIDPDAGPKVWPSSAGLVADVQAWVNDPSVNFGWIIRCAEGSAGDARRFARRESLDPAARPALTVTFTPACVADYNGSGTVSVQDIFDFLAGYFAGDVQADINNSGQVTVQDIFDFLAAYFAGC